ncbi:magnesium-translocating P-type ATPase [Jeotgalibaca sp. A127]|uniref:magnesium-translocating P-type ATPase n=1 Tax=Jeotgalibaca sp. A127 TaxID=3457324 RepID=UPI003FD65DA4
MEPKMVSYWSIPLPEALEAVQSGMEGLSSTEAAKRLNIYGENALKTKEKYSTFRAFLNQFKNPIILILLFATIVSGLTGDWFDAQIILLIVLISAILSFYQEYSANQAIEKLKSNVQVKCSVKRDGSFVDIASQYIVPGDIIQLSTGSLIPADGLILVSDDLFVNQSVLTGESMASEKHANLVERDSSLEERSNCVFMGTSVFIGTGLMVVMESGSRTEYGNIAEQLTALMPETEFERGVRHFGYLLSQIMLILTLVVFAINVLLSKPAIDALLFSVALAVGITPQLLPAITSITLSSGARVMAKNGVIIRRLNSIENFGSMDTLCTDKTGTLTEGDLQLSGAVDWKGEESEEVFRLAYLNATLQKGMKNNLDEIIHNSRKINIENVEKLDEISFDFTRRRVSVLYREDGISSLVTKGAFSSVLEVSKYVTVEGKIQVKDAVLTAAIEKRYKDWSDQGIRVLGLAYKAGSFPASLSVSDERDMIFTGFLLFYDPPKVDSATTLAELKRKGVGVRIITGDNKFIALHTAETVGLKVTGIITGKELAVMSDEVLWKKIEETTVFAEVDPNQKERIIIALKKKGHVVGYMGDGINDVTALHAADVSITVDNAVDVAKELADIVLMQKSLAVLSRGIEEGRTTFSNTLKYIWVTTSANFGNMFSVAGISMILPFFPLLTKQILLLNFMTDFPALALSSDNVDNDVLKSPQKWDMRFIRNFMLTFGLLSSVFDYVTTFLLFTIFRESQGQFQSGWFVFSIFTELVTLMVMRTKKPFYLSKPGKMLAFFSVFLGIFTLILLYTPLAKVFSLQPIPLSILLMLGGLLILYVFSMEIIKKIFYQHAQKM